MSSLPGGPLDLSDANTAGFEALDAGTYTAEVFAITNDAIKNTSGEGKMPAGTPMMKVQFRILEPMINGEVLDQDRRAFTQFTFPPADYDPKKAATMKGMIARFFMACGDDEAKVKSKKFAPDYDDYIGRQVRITLSKEQKWNTLPEDNEWDNKVKGVKPVGSDVASGGLL